MCPEWLTNGQTTLVSRKKSTKNPTNYRPITCLPVIYKILSSVITSRLTSHNEANNIIPTEQKGNSSNTFGKIYQLMINKMVMDSVRRGNVTFLQHGLTTRKPKTSFHTTGWLKVWRCINLIWSLFFLTLPFYS